MDDRTEQELFARLDHIEQYLVHLGAVSGYRYATFADSQAAGPFGADPAQGFPGPAGYGFPDDILAMAKSGKVIQAVKMYRDRTGVGLAQAKMAIDQALGRGY